ncbi:MAG: hypothetical protein KKD77_20915 [Gammaproteobacteria bacterium]|nr:hypothetical protein [Gammaproteobacteria bacterium]
MVINIPRIDTPIQQVLSNKLNVMVNELGLKVFKVAQLSRQLKGFGGVIDVTYFRKSPKTLEGSGTSEGINTAMMNDTVLRASKNNNYMYAFIGANLNFEDDPFPQGLNPGSGKVVYLIDDDLKTPKECKSGRLIGYNREFLASQFGSGFFKIMDEEVEKEVKERYEAILKALEKERPVRKRIEKEMRDRSDQVTAQMRGQQYLKQVIDKGDEAVVEKLLEQVSEMSKQLAELKAKEAPTTATAPVMNKPYQPVSQQPQPLQGGMPIPPEIKKEEYKTTYYPINK